MSNFDSLLFYSFCVSYQVNASIERLKISQAKRESPHN